MSTRSDPQHGPFDGLAALYAMGALSQDERTAFKTHLEVCLKCVREVTSLMPVTHGLVHVAAPLEAPAALRARMLDQATGAAPGRREARDAARAPLDTPFATLGDPDTPTLVVEPPRRRSRVLLWLAATLLVAAAGAGGWYAAGLDRQIRGLREDLDAATGLTARAELELEAARTSAADREAVLGFITGPGVQQLDLAGQPLAPRASARAFWNDASEMIFLATGLPSLPAGDVYQLWFVLPDAPVRAALVEPDPAGDATVLLAVPDVVTLPAALAVTVEPAGGVETPTGNVYLLGQPGG